MEEDHGTHHQSIELVLHNQGQKMMMESDAIRFQHKVPNLQYKGSERYMILMLLSQNNQKFWPSKLIPVALLKGQMKKVYHWSTTNWCFIFQWAFVAYTRERNKAAKSLDSHRFLHGHDAQRSCKPPWEPSNHESEKMYEHEKHII